jgi:hypothetical protein
MTRGGCETKRKSGEIHFYQGRSFNDGGEYVRGAIYTNNIEGFWGTLKRKTGCIGGMQRKYLSWFGGRVSTYPRKKDHPLQSGHLLLYFRVN